MINSIIKVSAILDAFSADLPRLSLAQMAEMTGYPKTTLYTLAATLVHVGLLERAGDSYVLGKRVVSLSQAVRVNVEIRDRAAPILRELADATRESVYLTVPDGTWVLYLYAIESSHRLAARSAIGDQAHFHCTAVGKAMLAFMSKEDRARIIAEHGLPAVTSSTITTAKVLEAELATIRERGFSTDNAENEPEIYCIGAPILDHTGSVIGATSVSGNSENVVTEVQGETASRVLEAADRISRRMGYVPRRPVRRATSARS
jgi:IclR family transcriptional regulator, acetate operon repressor